MQSVLRLGDLKIMNGTISTQFCIRRRIKKRSAPCVCAGPNRKPAIARRAAARARGRTPRPQSHRRLVTPPPQRTKRPHSSHILTTCQKWMVVVSKTVVVSACPSASESPSTVISGAQARSDIGPDMDRISLLSLFPVAVTGPQPSGPTGRARTVTVSFRPGSRPPRGRH
jgi:hypothetical protein